MKDYYQTLGVSKNATQEEIKKAFRRLAHQHHPDKDGGNEAKFKEINEAYQVLGNPQKRQQYDQFGTTFDGASSGGAGFSGFDFNNFRTQGFNVNFEDLDLEDIFSDMFGFGGGARRQKRAQGGRGVDIQVDLNLDFEKVFTGSQETIHLRKEVVCPRCHGRGAEPGSRVIECSRCQGTGQIRTTRQTFLGSFSQVSVCPECGGEGKKINRPCTQCQGAGRVVDEERIVVNIPAGVRDGEIIKVEGKGEAGVRGAASGDLYLKIHLKPSRYFERHGDDVLTSIDISFTQAALGGEVQVKTYNGAVKLKIPAGTQSGKIFKLSGKGIPRLTGRGRGDQLVKINVVVPRHLSRRERALLKELEREGGETANVDKNSRFWSFF